MALNADFSQRALVRDARNDWVSSPAAGVARKMLDRIGDEVARATTIVRFEPGSAFAAHTHDAGEEYLVLEGVFQDEQGDFPAGAYVRNPPTSRHTPRSGPGATILVKLRQFDPEDRTSVVIATDKAAPVRAAGRPGVAVLPLFADAHEEVRLELWDPGAEIDLPASGGLEMFVLEGGCALREGGDDLARWDWLRLPPGDRLRAVAGPKGARIWLKSGHLRTLV